jgi:hypothetical protein
MPLFICGQPQFNGLCSLALQMPWTGSLREGKRTDRIIYTAKYFLDLADLCFVLQKNGCIEVWHLQQDAQHKIFTLLWLLGTRKHIAHLLSEKGQDLKIIGLAVRLSSQ